MASPGHRAIMVSTGYNYVGFGAAVSADRQALLRRGLRQGTRRDRAVGSFGTVSKRSVDARHMRVTVRWSGGDTRLQVLTSGLRYFQVQWRPSAVSGTPGA